MVLPAEDRPSNELAEPLDRPTTRRILVQSQMRSQFELDPPPARQLFDPRGHCDQAAIEWLTDRCG